MPGISLLAGSEVDILADGRIDLSDEVLAQLDFVTASIHSGFQKPVDQIMKRLTAACENPHIDAIGHPTGRLLGRRDAYPVDIDRLVAPAVETNTILEINASYHRTRAQPSARSSFPGAPHLHVSVAQVFEGLFDRFLSPTSVVHSDLFQELFLTGE